MAIIKLFREQKLYLNGIKYEVKVYIDYKNFTYFIIFKEFNRQQVRWLEFLSEFNFQIIYRKGSKNNRADTFSRRSDYFEGREEQDIQLILKKERIEALFERNTNLISFYNLDRI